MRILKKTIHSKQSQLLQSHLIQARRNAGLTQQQLATRISKPQSFVAKYEGGERRLDVIEFINICDALEIDADKVILAVRQGIEAED